MKHGSMIERGQAVGRTRVSVQRAAELRESMGGAPFFTFNFQCLGPREADRGIYVDTRDRLALLRGTPVRSRLARLAKTRDVLALSRQLAEIPLESKWGDGFRNLVTTGGKNDLLDKYFAGSSYTAAWYMLLISATGYSAINAADTMASHSGWTESAAYSNSNRPSITFGAASAGSKPTSAAVVFNINGTITIKGAGVTSNNTKSGTTGILYSAGLFSGGDRAVANGDTLQVSGAWAV